MILFQRNARNYQAGTDNLDFTVDGSLTRLVLTLTHGDWPDGPCIQAEIQWDGVYGGTFTCSGGVVRDKGGNPTGGTASLTWTCKKPAGVTAGRVRIDVLQALNTAVLVEGF